MFLISEKEKGQREAASVGPVRGSGGEGECGPWTGAAVSSSEETETATS